MHLDCGTQQKDYHCDAPAVLSTQRPHGILEAFA